MLAFQNTHTDAARAADRRGRGAPPKRYGVTCRHDRHEALPGGGRPDQAPLQRRLGAQLGLRAAHGRTRSTTSRRSSSRWSSPSSSSSPSARASRSASRRRCPTSTWRCARTRRAGCFPGILRVLWAARRITRLRVLLLGVAAGVAGQGRRRAALPPHLGGRPAPGLRLGRGGLDPRGQRAHDQRPRSAWASTPYKTYRDLREAADAEARAEGGSHRRDGLRRLAPRGAARWSAATPSTLLVALAARRLSRAASACRVVEGGLDDERALAALVDGPGRRVPRRRASSPPAIAASSRRANRDGAARLARAARRGGRGAAGARLLARRDRPVAPGRARWTRRPAPGRSREYGRSKLAGEQAARESGAPLTIVRPPAVYGPRDRAFLTLFRAARRGLVPLLGDGRQELTLVHARDLAARARGGGGEPAHAWAAPTTRATRRPSRSASWPGRRRGARPRRCGSLPLPPAPRRAPVLGAGGRRRARRSAARPLLDADKCHELLAPGWACSSEALRRDAGWRAEIALADGPRRDGGELPQPGLALGPRAAPLAPSTAPRSPTSRSRLPSRWLRGPRTRPAGRAAAARARAGAPWWRGVLAPRARARRRPRPAAGGDLPARCSPSRSTPHVGLVNVAGGVAHDALVQGWEQALFGGQLSARVDPRLPLARVEQR